MRQPDFEEIWDADKWTSYRLHCRPNHARRYYQIRSLVRMAVWIPIAYFDLIGILCLVQR